MKVVTAQATVEPLMVGKMDYFLGWIVNQTYQIEQEAAKPDVQDHGVRRVVLSRRDGGRRRLVAFLAQ